MVIQFIFLKTGEIVFGLDEYKLPILESPKLTKTPMIGNILKLSKQIVYSIPIFKKVANKFSAYFIFYIAGVGVGLIWNFIMYSQVIWR